MAGAAALDGLVEGFLPGDPKFAVVQVAFVVVLFVALLTIGPRLPRRGLALVGPIGVALIAYALATSPGPGDGAILYALPVLCGPRSSSGAVARWQSWPASEWAKLSPCYCFPPPAPTPAPGWT